MKLAIIGAGMAGLACAEALANAAHDVTVFDKGSRPGGRMSTKILPSSLGGISFDYGAQYFVARDPAFRSAVETWRRRGLVDRWPAAGDEAWVGTPGMDSLVFDMASRSNVRWSGRVESLTRRAGQWALAGNGIDASGFDAVIVAVPAEQVGTLVEPFDMPIASLAARTPSEPCWTVMAAFSYRLPIEADVIKDRGAIAWAARNSAKPNRPVPEAWVIQASPDWSLLHLDDDKDDVMASLMTMFANGAEIESPMPIAVAAHRWRFAKSGRANATCLWNSQLKLGVCGDWLIGPRIEAAWISGRSLAGAIG